MVEVFPVRLFVIATVAGILLSISIAGLVCCWHLAGHCAFLRNSE
jgi:hypothetical protein